MDEKTREAIALFRYGLIAPLVNGQVEPKLYLNRLEQQVHDIPHYGERKIATKTVQEWCLHYRRHGFEALKPKKRADKGYSRRLSTEEQQHVLALREQHREMSATVFYDWLVRNGDIRKTEVSYSTVYRLIKKHGLMGRDGLPSPERKRFAHDEVNALWQADLSHGPYVPLEGRSVKTFLIAYIDDCSRAVPHAQFFPSEKFDGLRIVTKEALLRRGKPKMIYADNGKIYRSETLQYVCANLGITLAHTQPYDPQSKGKIERFFRTVQTRFYPLLHAKPAASLEELNQRFGEWLEHDYHRKVHTSLDGKTPHEVFSSQLSRLQFVDDVEGLDALFLKREQRKVRSDGTITLQKQLYEVPPRFIGQKVDIRMDEHDVYLYEDGKEVMKLRPVSLTDNAHTKRPKRAVSFSSLPLEGEMQHV